MNTNLKVKSHIITGIKRTIPLILIYSVFLALSSEFSFPSLFHEIILFIVVPFLMANILFSFKRFYYIFPAVVSGILASYYQIGILGGIICSVAIIFFVFHIEQRYEGLSVKRVIFINIVVSLIMYVITVFVVTPPITFLLDYILSYLSTIDKTNVILLVATLSFLVVVDLGGPFNKLAFTFLIELLLNENYQIVGPVLISVTVPPLSILVALILFEDKFNSEDQSQFKFAMISSVFGITEGALAIAFRRVKILVLLVISSVIASVFAALMNLESHLLIAGLPGVIGVNNVFYYLFSHVIGVAMFIILFSLFIKKENVITNNHE